MGEQLQGDTTTPAGIKGMTSRWGPVGRVAKAVRDELALAAERRRQERIVRDDIGLRPGQGLEELLTLVSEKRGRPVDVVYRELPPDEESGWCLRAREWDRIIIDTRADPLLRLAIAGHEIGHLWQDDEPLTDGHAVEGHAAIDSAVLAAALSELPEELVHEVLARPVHGRSKYGPVAERRAEIFGSVVIQMLALQEDTSGTGAIRSSFEHRRAGI